MENISVNHPDHYFKEGQLECIELIETLTDQFSGVVAYCIGNIKYLYRMGKKRDAALSLKEKTLEDVQKFQWYIKYARAAIDRLDDRCSILWQTSPSPLEIKVIQREFTKDKPPLIAESISKIIAELGKKFNGQNDLMESLRKVELLINEIISAVETSDL